MHGAGAPAHRKPRLADPWSSSDRSALPVLGKGNGTGRRHVARDAPRLSTLRHSPQQRRSGPQYPLDVVLRYQHYPPTDTRRRGPRAHRTVISGTPRLGDRATQERHGPGPHPGRLLLFGGFHIAGGQGESGLSLSGASLDHASCSSAVAACFGASAPDPTSRSPRPGVSPSCPEHGGLASLRAHARANQAERLQGPSGPARGSRASGCARIDQGRWY